MIHEEFIERLWFCSLNEDRQALIAHDDAQNILLKKYVGLLRRVEWYQPMSNTSPSCPVCENQEHFGHDKGCELASILHPVAPQPVEALRCRHIFPSGAICGEHEGSWCHGGRSVNAHVFEK